MALRVRITGEIYCAAKTKEQYGDTYINDNIHYYLSELTGAIRPSKTEDKDGLWFWNIKEDSLRHYAELRNHQEMVQPRRENKYFLNINEWIQFKNE